MFYLYCRRVAKLEVITSAANPLVKDVRRAIVRGSLTAEGYCVAETFHLLEEALRSDCEVRTVLAAQSVQSIVEQHVRSLAGIRLIAVADANLRGKCGLIIGNEARGVSAELRSAAQDLSIPTVGVESLNAAVAAAILLYEARRQRTIRP